MSLTDSGPLHCSVCGFTEFSDHAILWPELIAAWELSPAEVAVIDRQQGRTCRCCFVGWRSMSLAAAIMDCSGHCGFFGEFVKEPRFQSLQVLVINKAGHLTPWLTQLRGHQLVEYPAIDRQSLPMADESFDLIVHSDTMEHVPDPLQGLASADGCCRPGGRAASRFLCWWVG